MFHASQTILRPILRPVRHLVWHAWEGLLRLDRQIDDSIERSPHLQRYGLFYAAGTLILVLVFVMIVAITRPLGLVEPKGQERASRPPLETDEVEADFDLDEVGSLDSQSRDTGQEKPVPIYFPQTPTHLKGRKQPSAPKGAPSTSQFENANESMERLFERGR